MNNQIQTTSAPQTQMFPVSKALIWALCPIKENTNGLGKKLTHFRPAIDKISLTSIVADFATEQNL